MPRPETPPTLQFITNEFGDELLYEVNRNTFSRLGAGALYQQHFGKRLLQEDTLYLVVGTDSGLLPSWLLQRELPAGSRYIFIELPELYATLEAKYSEFDDNDHVAFVTLNDWQQLTKDFRFQDYAYLDRIFVIHSLGATDAFVPAYHSARYAVEQEVERFSHGIKVTAGNHAFIRRQIENTPDNLVPAICLKGGFEKYTAVLLGGGPSLDDILPWVIENRSRLTVFAVSRIARQLLAAGVEPDVVASVDPHPVSFDVSKEMLRFSEHCLLVNAYHISPLLLAQWRGPSIYRGAHYPWTTTQNAANLPNVGPTVSNTALAMAVDMGFSQIILAGVDLCFSREGYTHASGSNERKAGSSLGRVGIQVETNAGNLADTDHAFLQAVATMGTQAVGALARGTRIINPSQHAARIRGVEYIPLSHLEIPSAQPDFRTLCSKRLPGKDGTTLKKQLTAVKEELAHTNGQIRAITHLVDEALECNRGLFGRDGKQADFRFKKRMDKIERKLDTKHKSISLLIKDYGASLFLRLSRPDRTREWTDEELEKFGQGYYDAYRASAKSLLTLIESMQLRIESRLHELAPNPSIVNLFKQWQADRTLGRSHIWRKNNSAKLTADEEQILALADHEFEAILEEKNTLQAQRVKQTLGLSLGPIRSKLLVLFNTNNNSELARIAEQLANMEGVEAEDLHALALGYIAEINSDADTALDHYNNILDRTSVNLAEDPDKLKNPRLEDALRRMSHITLYRNDEQSALIILEALATISPTYEPQYGDLLHMTGNTEQAINIYTAYAQKAPHDHNHLLKLGKLYQEIGQTDSAHWIYRHILEKDPDNTAAQQHLNGLNEKTSE